MTFLEVSDAVRHIYIYIYIYVCVCVSLGGLIMNLKGTIKLIKLRGISWLPEDILACEGGLFSLELRSLRVKCSSVDFMYT